MKSSRGKKKESTYDERQMRWEQPSARGGSDSRNNWRFFCLFFRHNTNAVIPLAPGTQFRLNTSKNGLFYAAGGARALAVFKFITKNTKDTKKYARAAAVSKNFPLIRAPRHVDIFISNVFN